MHAIVDSGDLLKAFLPNAAMAPASAEHMLDDIHNWGGEVFTGRFALGSFTFGLCFGFGLFLWLELY